MGSYEQRRFASGALLDGDPGECARILRRYLAFDAVVSGRSHRHAQEDYDTHKRQIVAEQEFESVFRALVTEGDAEFVRLFCDRVEHRSRIRPGDTKVRRFLRTMVARIDEPDFRDKKPNGKKRHPTSRPHSLGAGQGSGAASFTCFGQTIHCRNDTEVLVGVMKALGQRDSGLYERLAPHLEGRRRRGLSRDRSQLYPADSAPGILSSAEPLPGGWWLATHSSSRVKEAQLKKAREVAGIPLSECVWMMKGKT